MQSDQTVRDEDMADFTSADVKRLRDATGAGILDCKNALAEAGGDFEQAVELLRLKGVKDVARRATRTAANGLIAAALVQRAADRLAVLALEVRPGVTAQQLIDEAGASLKEKLELGRYALLEGGYVASYLHRSDRALPPTVGVLVQLDEPNEQAGKDVAQQVAAMRPQYVTRDQVPADIVGNERRIAEQITRDEGKPEQAIPKIVEGRLGAFFKDVALVEQPFVKEPKKTVKQMLSEQGATVRAFARFQIGQAG